MMLKKGEFLTCILSGPLIDKVYKGMVYKVSLVDGDKFKIINQYGEEVIPVESTFVLTENKDDIKECEKCMILYNQKYSTSMNSDINCCFNCQTYF